LGRIWSGGPEVHADGEIWAQTLWDLRGAVGVSDARFLITEAMRLSPRNPSFLDMRNAILQANQVGAEGGRTDRRGAIWDVFAGRGMGYFAAVESADDTAPLESFVAPPDPGDGVGSLAGTVRDADTGAPLAGVRVEFAGLGDLSDTTNASGAYSISDVPVGTYPKVVASKTGYTRAVSEDVVVAAEAETALALQLRRDWAAFSRGGRIHAHTGPDFTAFGCGPAHAIDQSQATGWSSTTGAARSLTVKLPAFADVVAFGVDPGAICGDDESASTAGYRIQTSKTAASGSWTTVKTGAFALAEAHALNTIPIAKRKAVRYVRFTITSNHGDPDFMDLAELEVYGKLRPACFGKPATHLGTSAANVIRGTAGANVIVGLGGRDRINGRGGKDLICGGDGADRLTGGGGVDRIDGGAGNDTIYARDGRKEVTLRGGGGTDRARRDSFDRTSSVERRF
ncbi:MAG TPA: carboxypeptidase regulatory-like domain-containing protein, partial [Gaiellaceae bacterium]|nr:carboxypeptidase regulatory-like domain-containing protein [Gaiellaceae bacterium]